MSAPAFAVTLTTRNNAATVRECLESILPQVRGVGEVVVVDAGSTDGTAEILAELSRAWPELTVVSAPLNRGEGRSRAVRESRAPIVLSQVDADNRYFPGSFVAAATATASSDRDLLLVEGEHDPNPSCTRCYAWKRTSFERLGGYPPIQYEEDLAVIQHALHDGLRLGAYRVPRLGDDLKPRGPTTAFRLPVHRRLAPFVRTARLFRRLGYGYLEYTRFLWLTRRGAARFVGGVGLAAYAYLTPAGPASTGGQGHFPSGG